MAGMAVEVMIERGSGPADQVLTYAVPEALASRLIPGLRVAVPLGRRVAAGIVMAAHPADENQDRLKPVTALLSAEPFLDDVRIALADWLVERYLCRRCDAWRLFFPPGAAGSSRRRLIPSAARETIERRLERFILPESDLQRLRAILLALRRGGRTPEQLRRSLGPLYRQIEVMLAEGYLSWREPWQRSGPRARIVSGLRLAGIDPPEASPKQKRVLDYLAAKETRSASRAEILTACGVSRSVLDRLIAAGALAAVEQTSPRVPRERRNAASGGAPIELSAAQRAAVEWVRAHLGTGGRMLLHGVTGSGKTEVYLRAIGLAREAGRGAMLLVPEIGLTPQTVERVVDRFGERVAVLHSRLSEGERRDEWERIRTGEADVVVGPRSALFAPLRAPGVVVLDEEHDQAYKQEDGLRYHAREVAAELCRLTGAVLILGSATPSLEAMAACENGAAAYFALPERPGGRALPPVEIVDMRLELKSRRTGVLSLRLREALAECLDRGGQAILLLNRRGYATFVICRECGHVLRCPHCDVSLTYHQGQTTLLCHYCGYALRAPDTCPACRGRHIRYFGLGTERLCEEVAAFLPRARMARMDQDSTARKGAHLELYQALRAGEIDILVGTQMVAKGLDLPGVTLVGVVAADASLHRPDFRAAERTFQLLTQVAGRTGRGDRPGLVILQTYNPGHYSLRCVTSHDYLGFYRQERAARQAAGYPPFAEMARIGLAGPDESATWRIAHKLAVHLRQVWQGRPETVKVMGPAPALIKRVEDRFRFHILVKAASLAGIGAELAAAVQNARAEGKSAGVAMIVDVNPNTVL